MDATQQAISEWNNTLSYVHLIFTTYAVADITIRNDDEINLYDGDYYTFVLAQATWPLDSKPGPNVYINLNAGGDRVFSESQKTAIGINGTPNSGENTDPNSVMNRGTATFSWSGFSNYDLIAIRNLYPRPRVNILGPTKVYNNSTIGTWTASAAGGVPNYSYLWEYRVGSEYYFFGSDTYMDELPLQWGEPGVELFLIKIKCRFIL